MLRPKFAPNSSFSKELKESVEQYFSRNRIDKRGNLNLNLKVLAVFIIFCTLFISSLYFNLSLVSLILAASIIGILAGLITAHAHESIHMAFSKKTWVNKLLANFMNLAGGSKEFYSKSHSLHHGYTNVNDVDGDIDFKPFIRTNKNQQKHLWHRYQHVYTPFLYLFAGFFLVFDLKPLLYKKSDGFPKNLLALKKSEKINFFVWKIIHFGLFLILPIVILGLVKGLILYALTVSFCGLYLACLINPGHVNEKTVFSNSESSLNTDWVQNIIATTANFGQGNSLVNFLTAGLNYHLEHSLFPNVSQVHFKELHKIIVNYLADTDLQVADYKSFVEYFLSHLKYLKSVGQD
ncbi:MAG: fatty acid desaturase [bacterium]